MLVQGGELHLPEPFHHRENRRIDEPEAPRAPRRAFCPPGERAEWTPARRSGTSERRNYTAKTATSYADTSGSRVAMRSA